MKKTMQLRSGAKAATTDKKKKTTKKKNSMTKTKAKKGFTFDYAPSIESTSVVSLKEKYDLFINGKWTAPKTKKYFNTTNPATGKALAKIALAGESDVHAAVSAAKKALPAWQKLSGLERGKYLFRIARLLQERAREFAVLETMDGGKPIKESRDVDIPLAAQHFFYYAGWADKLELAFPGKKINPIGVCGQIIPWNFPLLMAAWKLAPALACGNTVVLKPAETTSLTALLLCEILIEAELPAGVINIVTGAGKTGQAIVDHPEVKKIAFTGSTEVGKLITKSVAATDKKLTMELGGKSANIVFSDAAIDQAIEGVINSIYFNQGHVCCAGSRLLVEENIHDEFVRKLKRRMKQLRVGNPLDKNTDIGAINSKEQLIKIQELVKAGKKDGGEFYETDVALPTSGNYHRPCFFDHVNSAHTISKTEVFGPVLAITTFRTPDEAIKKANDTEYGLAAGIWSEKGSKIHYVASQLNAGVIWCNTYNKFDAASPFGGFKESGHGREGGLHGLMPYVEVK